ncbi:MAG: ATP-binding cassette domain-containing protein [Bacteroidetes bacterium]|nr:ATP-binding cassette domain-containing protein [Bacteroidota bacterium]
MAKQNNSLSKAFGKLHQILLLDRADIGVIYMFAIFAGVVQLSLPLGIQSIVSFVMAGSLSTSIIVLIAMVVFGVFINGLLQVKQLQSIEKVKQKLFLRYSMEYADRLPKLNVEKLDKEYLPEMVNRYFDTVSLQKGLDKLVIELPTAIIQVLLGLMLLAFYHPVFIAFGLLLLSVVLIIIRFSSSNGFSTAMNASSYKYRVAAWLQEVARTIKSFKYSKETSLHLKKADELVGNYLQARTDFFKILLTQFWSLISFKIIITAAMLIIGSYLLINQQINVGQFIAADIVIIAIIGSVEKIITYLDTVYEALVSVEKLSVITEADKEIGGSLLLKSQNKGVSITFDNVRFAYFNGRTVLNNTSFNISPGEMVQLKGVSGSGKSTVLRMLTGAFTGYTGIILIDGIPAANYDIQSLRLHTGILLGSQDIFHGTIKENITMGNQHITLEEITSLAAVTGLDTFIKTCKEGYDSEILPLGNGLSNGVRRNILLMRALLGSHRLLLLEEPFEHLEETYKKRIAMYLKNDKTATILIASQDEQLKMYCDRVIELSKNGEVIQ